MIEYSGKLLIDQNGKEQFSFNIHVAINRNTSIIQIKKPLFGNVLKIIAAKDKDLTFIHLGNETKVDFLGKKASKDEGLINFEKLRMVAKEVRNLMNMCSGN